MKLDKTILPPGYEQHGLKAEFHPDGRLSRFGKQSNDNLQGWQLSIDPHKPAGQIERRSIQTFPDKYQGDPTTGKVAEEAFAEWVDRWVGEIYADAASPSRCSFCGKSNTEVSRLIAGPTAYICNECVGLCVDILGETG